MEHGGNMEGKLEGHLEENLQNKIWKMTNATSVIADHWKVQYVHFIYVMFVENNSRRGVISTITQLDRYQTDRQTHKDTKIHHIKTTSPLDWQYENKPKFNSA